MTKSKESVPTKAKSEKKTRVIIAKLHDEEDIKAADFIVKHHNLTQIITLALRIAYLHLRPATEGFVKALEEAGNQVYQHRNGKPQGTEPASNGRPKTNGTIRKTTVRV